MQNRFLLIRKTNNYFSLWLAYYSLPKHSYKLGLNYSPVYLIVVSNLAILRITIIRFYILYGFYIILVFYFILFNSTNVIIYVKIRFNKNNKNQTKNLLLTFVEKDENFIYCTQ